MAARAGAKWSEHEHTVSCEHGVYLEQFLVLSYDIDASCFFSAGCHYLHLVC